MKKLGERTIEALAAFVIGDGGLTMNRDLAKLFRLFSRYGFEDTPPDALAKRKPLAVQRLHEINGTDHLVHLIEEVFKAINCIGGSNRNAIKEFNRYLRDDGLTVVTRDGQPKLQSMGGPDIALVSSPVIRAASEDFIKDQRRKCDQKLRDRDYDRAITNARSLCEQVLCDIERQLNPAAPRYDGELPKLFRRVRKELKLEPENYKDREDIVQLLGGLFTVVNGFAGMSNELGDRHGGSDARPEPHHAQLAVNVANTLCSFMLACARLPH